MMAVKLPVDNPGLGPTEPGAVGRARARNQDRVSGETRLAGRRAVPPAGGKDGEGESMGRIDGNSFERALSCLQHRGADAWATAG